MALSFGFALPNAGNNFRGDIFSQLLPADQRVEAASGTQEVANGCLDNRVVELRAIVPEVTNTNLLFNSSMAGATGSVLPTNWASGSVSGLTYKISSASTVQGLRSIEWTVSGTALSDGDLWLACEPMQSGTVSAQIPSEYVGSMYCAKVSGTIKAGMVLQTLTQNFINGAVQETITKDLAAVTGQTFVRIEPNSVKTDVDLENRVNLRLYQSIASGEVIDFTIRVAAPQVEAGVTASPFISTVSGAVSEVRGRPSILVVPQLTKAGTLYPQLPTVSGADFTVSRNTTATRVNSSGLIESVASGVPRIDWLGQSCPALLVEASGQNLCLQSTDTTTSWSLGANLTSGAIDVIGVSGINLTVAASGSTIGAATGSNRMTTINATLTSGSTYTISFLVKKTGAHTIGGFFANTSGATQTAFGSGFDVSGSFSSGSLIASSPITNRIRRVEQWGTDVYRCSETFTMTETNVLTVLRLGPVSGVTSFSNSAVGTQLGFAAPQIELGAFPTSFIPTTSGTGSRAADVISASGALVSGLIGQTEGTIYVEVDVRSFTASAARRIVNIRVDGNNLLSLEMSIAGNSFDFVATSGGVSVTPTASGITTGIYKIAVGYNSAASGTVLFVNGVLRDTKTIAIPNLSAAVLGLGTRADGAVGSQLNDRIRAVALYTTRLSNDQLAELTRL